MQEMPRRSALPGRRRARRSVHRPVDCGPHMPAAWTDHPPLVGRQRELRALDALVDALRGGRGGVVLLAGDRTPPGRGRPPPGRRGRRCQPRAPHPLRRARWRRRAGDAALATPRWRWLPLRRPRPSGRSPWQTCPAAERWPKQSKRSSEPSTSSPAWLSMGRGRGPAGMGTWTPRQRPCGDG